MEDVRRTVLAKYTFSEERHRSEASRSKPIVLETSGENRLDIVRVRREVARRAEELKFGSGSDTEGLGDGLHEVAAEEGVVLALEKIQRQGPPIRDRGEDWFTVILLSEDILRLRDEKSQSVDSRPRRARGDDKPFL